MPFRNYNEDFEALIRIYSTAEGGRKTPVFNGIRWDFAYAEPLPEDTLYMIHPDFKATDGRSLPRDKPLLLGMEIVAGMLILNDDLRVNVHRGRIVPGLRFYCQEGGRRVAEGVVTRLIDLNVPRV